MRERLNASISFDMILLRFFFLLTGAASPLAMAANLAIPGNGAMSPNQKIATNCDGGGPCYNPLQFAVGAEGRVAPYSIREQG